MGTFKVICGDISVGLGQLADSSFDACLCDPPYELGFMGKRWDSSGVAFDPATWRSVLRVLKPGAMLVAFGGTRTHHRLMCAVEDAGFEIRDCLMWLYGSGFPKSLDISKAIDKAAGAERASSGPKVYADGTAGHWGASDKYAQDAHTRSLTGLTPKLNTAPATDAAKLWDGYGTALKPAWEPIVLAMKPCDGTFVGNALKYGVAGLNIDAGRIAGSKPDTTRGAGGQAGKFNPIGAQGRIVDDGAGRWPANVLLDPTSAAMLDEQTKDARASKPSNTGSRFQATGLFPIDNPAPASYDDLGGAARFFYCAKADSFERHFAGKNDHPTVKPVDLCAYLSNLILPPAGARRLLVPFSGSGSEMMGALRAGWQEVVGIDSNQEYCDLAQRRIACDSPLLNLDALAESSKTKKAARSCAADEFLGRRKVSE